MINFNSDDDEPGTLLLRMMVAMMVNMIVMVMMTMMTLLMIREGNTSMVHLLLTRNALVDGGDTGTWSPLLWAAYTGHHHRHHLHHYHHHHQYHHHHNHHHRYHENTLFNTNFVVAQQTTWLWLNSWLLLEQRSVYFVATCCCSPLHIPAVASCNMLFCFCFCYCLRFLLLMLL